jgi:SNF2 family DNA or RNA helicase
MKITFNSDNSKVLFLHENKAEASKLENFPGFEKAGNFFTCPAKLMIAYNLVTRCNSYFTNIEISPLVQSWLNSDFKLLDLPNNFKFFTKPLDFQLIALRFLYTHGSAGLLLDPGMGKSKVVLDYIALMGFSKSIIVCPAALLFVWEDEIEKHRPDLNGYVVKSTSWDEELPGITSANVIIINYNKMVILKHRLKELSANFIHLDEFLIKDPKTTRSQSALELGRRIPYRCGGSGTLVNNTPLDVFNPVRFLQPSLVGWNFMNFMEKFAITKEAKKPEGASNRARTVVVGYRGKQEIKSMLDTCCIVMTKERWLKLPKKTFHDIFVPMGPEQEIFYDNLRRNYYAEINGKEVKIDNPLVMMSKLYQVSQGFVYVAKEEPGEIIPELFASYAKKKYKPKPVDWEFFSEQPKIKVLETLLTETLKGKKAIIWFNLNAELKLIQELLTKLDHEYVTIKGGDKTIGQKVRAFNKSTTTKWLVCQSKSVNYGITVLGTKAEDLEEDGVEVFPDLNTEVFTEVFYSINFSLEVFLQQQDRIHRLGQTNECNYYRIFTNSPMEMKLKKAIEDKVTLKEEMLVDFAQSLLET